MSEHSITQLLVNLREGQDVSVAQSVIWRRFFHRLKALAGARIDSRMRRVVDGEDIAIAALNDFFAQVDKDGAFPQLTDRESLWPLLAKITSRKAINEFRRENAKKRGGGEVRGESVFGFVDDGSRERGIEQIERELTPEFADELFLGFEDVLAALKRYDEKFYEVAILRLKGFSTSEIAKELGFSNAKTPERIIKQVRILWKSFYGGLAQLTVINSSTGERTEININEEPTLVGRQRQGEPQPYWTGVSEIAGQTTRRVVVAQSTQKSISRNHARVEVVDEGKIKVSNPSRNSKIWLNSDRVLEPGDEWSATEPCSMRLNGDLSIGIDLA